LIGESPIKPS